MRVFRFFTLCFVPIAVPIAVAAAQTKPGSSDAGTAHVPTYTSDGKLQPPTDYRQWIYLTSGLDMSYTPRVAGTAGMSMFDNVFVTLKAFRYFQEHGTWPDKTMLALESRGAQGNASINKAGHFQGQDVMGVEIHVKDEARGGWAFYAFDGNKPAERIPSQASCYSCHQEHAAVDTTFVQFYPTLLPLAQEKGTLSSSYLKDESTAR